jgi:hypothetical protein
VVRGCRLRRSGLGADGFHQERRPSAGDPSLPMARWSRPERRRRVSNRRPGIPRPRPLPQAAGPRPYIAASNMCVSASSVRWPPATWPANRSWRRGASSVGAQADVKLGRIMLKRPKATRFRGKGRNFGSGRT